MKFIYKHIYTTLRILLGIVFILSAMLKLSPIAPFENLVLKLDIVPWNWVPYVARGIIGFEFALGFLLVANIYIRYTLRFTVFTLLAFTLFLGYLHIFVSTQDNCGCFGEIVELNPIQSIIKNILLLLVVLFLLRKKALLPVNIFEKFQPYIAMVMILGSVSLPFVFNSPITAGEGSNYVVRPNMKIEHESMQHIVTNTNDTLNLTQNKQIICFASLTCSTCKFAISKLESIHKKNPSFAITIIFLDRPQRDSLLTELIKKTGLSTIPYSFLPKEEFFKTSHNKLPFIMFVDNGEIKDLRNYDDLYIGTIFTYFEQ